LTKIKVAIPRYRDHAPLRQLPPGRGHPEHDPGGLLSTHDAAGGEVHGGVIGIDLQ
jgi:hypothetical protein